MTAADVAVGKLVMLGLFWRGGNTVSTSAFFLNDPFVSWLINILGDMVVAMNHSCIVIPSMVLGIYQYLFFFLIRLEKILAEKLSWGLELPNRSIQRCGSKQSRWWL